MANSNANNPQIIAVTVGTVAAASVVPVCYLPRKFHLLGAHLVNDVAIAASDTDYATLTLKVGANTCATLDTRAANQGAVAADTAKAFVLAAAYDNAAGAIEPLEAGTVSLTYAEGGTMTLTSAVVQLYGYFK